MENIFGQCHLTHIDFFQKFQRKLIFDMGSEFLRNGLNYNLGLSLKIHMKLPKDFGTQLSILSVFHKTPTPLDRLQHMLSSAWFNAFVQITKDRGVILKT